MSSFERFVTTLRTAYSVRGSVKPHDSWDAQLIRDVQRLSRGKEDESASASVFFRLGFAALLLTVLVHAGYKMSDIEERAMSSALTQLDPFNVWSSLRG